jgi:hypothetical protein
MELAQDRVKWRISGSASYLSSAWALLHTLITEWVYLKRITFPVTLGKCSLQTKNIGQLQTILRLQDRPNTGIMSSNPDWGMIDIVFLSPCMGRSTVQGVLPTIFKYSFRTNSETKRAIRLNPWNLKNRINILSLKFCPTSRMSAKESAT